MRIFLFLFLFASAVFADVLQQMYQTSIKDVLDDNSYMLNTIMIIFTAFGMGFLLMIIKFRDTKEPEKGKILHHMAILSTKYDNRKYELINITKLFDGYFSVLHTKTAKNNNSIIFDIAKNVPKMAKINYKMLCPMYFFLVEFVNDCVKDSVIIMSIKLSKRGDKLNGIAPEFEFNVICDKKIADMKNGNIEKTLFMKNNILIFKKLGAAAKIARTLDIKIFFDEFARHSKLSFKSSFEASHQYPPRHRNEGDSVIILENSHTKYFDLSSKLDRIGLNTIPRFDLDLAKKHLFSVFFSPSYVFINTSVLRAFDDEEIKQLEKSQKNHGFDLILISDNKACDDFTRGISNFQLLKRPFSLDALRAAMDTPVKQPESIVSVS